MSVRSITTLAWRTSAALAVAIGVLPLAHASPCPEDTAWLRRDCGDGALAVHDRKSNLFLVELRNPRPLPLGTGRAPEFSPDGSKLAWIDGTNAVGCARRAPATRHTIAHGVESEAGVHWLGDDEVALRFTNGVWRAVRLDGRSRELPELTKLGAPGRECDVKCRDDGVWVLVGGTAWKSSDGKSGRIPGTCSVSLSPDGRSVTSLNHGHKSATLTAIVPGGQTGTLAWPYTGAPKNKGFDNHRWSSNDARYVLVADEGSGRMAVLSIATGQAVQIGPPAEYGDFTVGSGDGRPWPEPSTTGAGSAGNHAERTPP